MRRGPSRRTALTSGLRIELACSAPFGLISTLVSADLQVVPLVIEQQPASAVLVLVVEHAALSFAVQVLESPA